MSETTAVEAAFGVYGSPPSALVSLPATFKQFSPLFPGAESLEKAPTGSLAGMAMFAAPSTLERRHDLALMLRVLAPDAAFSVLAPKHMGGSRLHAELSAFGCTVESSAKRHHRICVGRRPARPEGLETAITDGAPRRLPDVGLWSQPGIFSWDRLDPGTALLLGALPPLSGHGADFGCGIGLLAHAALASDAVTGLELVDIDRRAMEACQRNVDDPRARFRWADVRSPLPFGNLDFVITNPPFHEAGREDRALGITFIQQAARALRTGGRLWLVANRHLPYEQVLKPLFRQRTLVTETPGFKVYSALK